MVAANKSGSEEQEVPQQETEENVDQTSLTLEHLAKIFSYIKAVNVSSQDWTTRWFSRISHVVLAELAAEKDIERPCTVKSGFLTV